VLLTDLHPRFVNAGGPAVTDGHGNPITEQEGVGMSFDCPCGCGIRGYVDFVNTLDGSKNRSKAPHWTRTGRDFASLTLYPSIRRSTELGGCGWHGWFKEGQVSTHES